ncbi:MAG: OmpA family protein [Hyphomicrobiales bacterium]|nr:OmpA family protein [Hyphomicrobiales bacterium]
MSYNSAKWWPGALLAAVGWAAMNAGTTGAVEGDLVARAGRAVGDMTMATATLAASGRDVSLAGAAFTPAAREAASIAALKTPGVRLVDSAGVTTVPVAKPYVWRARLGQGAIALSGSAPDKASRDALFAAAKAAAPGGVASDKMNYAAGAPADYAAASAFAFSLLPKFATADASLTDGVLSVAGAAKDPASYAAALDALKSPPGQVAVGTVAVTPPPVAPYVWSATSDGKALRIEGDVPDPPARAATLAAAKAAAPAMGVEDVGVYASGAPTGDYAAAKAAALVALAGLASGEARFEDANVSLRGTAKSYDDPVSLAAAFAKALPPGFSLAKADVAPAVAKPYLFSLERGAQGVTLDGFAPDDAARDAAISVAKGAGLGAVTSHLRIASGAVAGVDYPATEAAALAALKSLTTGRVALSDASASITGIAPSAEAAIAATEALARSGPGVAVVSNAIEAPPALPPPPPPPAPVADASSPPSAPVAADGPPLAAAQCQSALNDDLASATVKFATGKAALDPASYPLLGHVAATALRCAAAKLEVDGYTDDMGDAAANVALSERRARSVVAFLIGAGVSGDRLSAKGLGAADPVADNSTSAGRAKNRRIEIKVVP